MDQPADPFSHLPPRRPCEIILASPRFPQARDVYLQSTLTALPGSDDRQLVQLLNAIGRAALFSVILGHFFLYMPAVRQTWPTVGAVRRSFLSLRVGSSRSLDHVLARMQSMGLIGLHRPETDGRLRLVLPTRRMLDLDLKWLAAQFAAIGVIDPDAGIGEALHQGDQRYQRAIRFVASQERHIARRTIDETGPLRPILERQDATQILASCLLAPREKGEVSLSFRDLAEALSTTRTHIHNIFDDLAALGLVTLVEPGGHRIALSPELIARTDNYIATVIANYERGWHIAHWLVENDARFAQSFSPMPSA